MKYALNVRYCTAELPGYGCLIIGYEYGMENKLLARSKGTLNTHRGLL